MIKIDKIRPVDASGYIDLTSIKTEYLRRIKNYTSPYKFLKDITDKKDIIVRKITYKYSDFSNDELTFLKYLYDEFDKIITGEPQILSDIIDSNNIGLIGKEKKGAFGIQFKVNSFGKKINEIFGYDKAFRKTQYKAMWLAKKLNIMSCPYCNSQYTLVVNKDSKNSQAKFQFDHFFPKKRFPFLSLSLYNLIPSCANCNLAKGDRYLKLDEYYHPYHSSLNEIGGFYSRFDIDIDKLSLGDVQDLPTPISFEWYKNEHKAFIESHDKLYNIQGVYSRLEYEVKRLLRIAIVNNKSQQDSSLAIKGLFPDHETYIEYLIGNPLLEESILNKPMSKFNIDIANRFNII